MNRQGRRAGLLSESGMARAFRALAGAVFGVLLLCAFVLTCANDGMLGTEVVWIQWNAPLTQAAALLFVVLGMLLLRAALRRFVRGRISQRAMDAAAALLSLGMAAAAALWVMGNDFVLVGDQAHLVNIAQQANAGDYSAFQAGGYANMHRHQLGMISLLRVLLGVFGDYRAMQLLSAALAGVICMLCYGIVRQLAPQSRTAQACVLALLALFLPLPLYTPFVYGEIPSTACVLAGALLFLRYMERGGSGRLALLGLVCGAAVLLRKNALIALLGLLAAALVRLLFARDGRGAKAGAAMLAGVALMQAAVSAAYAPLIPAASDGMPSILYIAMGLTEGRQPGWWNGYNNVTFAQAGYSAAEATRQAWQTIGAFFDRAGSDPGYAADFMMKKMVTQWEAPMLQAMAMNMPAGEHSALCEALYFGALRGPAEALMKAHQMFVYAMALCFLCFKRDGRIAPLSLLIGIFGGFLFTLMWEAKTRYVFPYMIMLLPYAAVGFSCLAERLDKRRRAAFGKACAASASEN